MGMTGAGGGLGPDIFRQCLHETRSIWNLCEICTVIQHCVYTGHGGSSMDQICYLVPNGSTYVGDHIWNRTISVLKQSLANRVDPYHGGSDPKRI